jgi:excisionase family DNA binding protein
LSAEQAAGAPTIVRDGREWVTPEEAARRLGLSIQHTYRLLHDQQILGRFWAVDGTRFLFAEAQAVADYAEALGRIRKARKKVVRRPAVKVG